MAGVVEDDLCKAFALRMTATHPAILPGWNGYGLLENQFTIFWLAANHIIGPKWAEDIQGPTKKQCKVATPKLMKEAEEDDMMKPGNGNGGKKQAAVGSKRTSLKVGFGLPPPPSS